MVPRRIAQLGRRFFPPGLWEGPSDRPWVALTFDDGPHPEVTGPLLDALRRVQAPAAFFLIGSKAQGAPDLARRIQAEGHEVGNHTWDHVPLGYGRRPSVQLARTEELLEKLCPGSPRIFRPPFGAILPGGPGALTRQGIVPVYWSVVPADWDPLTPEQMRQRVLDAVHPGAVIVLHAGRPWHSGGSPEAVEDLVRDLRAQDYEIVPVSRMLKTAGYEVATR